MTIVASFGVIGIPGIDRFDVVHIPAKGEPVLPLTFLAVWMFLDVCIAAFAPVLRLVKGVLERPASLLHHLGQVAHALTSREICHFSI